MRKITEAVIQEVVDRFVECSNPRQIILFGSHARGDADEDSDLDFLVIEDEPFGPERSRHEEWRRLYESLRGCGVAVDILLFAADEVEKWRTAINHVVYDALTEGEVIYERP